MTQGIKTYSKTDLDLDVILRVLCIVCAETCLES